MKHFKDFKEEIHGCSKCGLCQAVCPIYKETGNDCSVSRGLFIMLDGILKGDIELNSKVNEYLDTCLKCDKCKEFCPTNIDVVRILMSAKHEYYKKSLKGKINKFLTSKYIFNTILKVAHEITYLFHPRKKSKRIVNPKAKVVYFGGCIENFKPDVRNYVVDLLNFMNIEVINIPLGCCGIPFLTFGNLDRFVEQAKSNIKKLKKIDFDYIVTDCASCQHTLKEYKNYIEEEEEFLSNLQFKSIYELINENNIKFEPKKRKKTVTLHKPCHEKAFEDILKIIKNIELEYKELDGYDECCGFASFEHPTSLKTTSKIIDKKGENIQKLNPDYVLTSCLGCCVSMSIATKFKIKARRLISFLKDECKYFR